MTTAGDARRDFRIDMLRGAALLMIFADHIPRDALGFVTLHAFGFCDAAEVFVLLAGFSSMLAYGRPFARDGAMAGLWRIALRCARIYLFQIGLLLTTLGVVLLWRRDHPLQSSTLAPIFNAPVTGLAYGLTLRALPSYLDILPLYIVLLAAFPLIYFAMRRGLWFALVVSAAVWAVANLDPFLDFPNWMDGKGWYFDPFAWQLLFTIGATLAVIVSRRESGVLPHRRWAVALCTVYLGVAFLEAAPWTDWDLPSLRLFAMQPPEKSLLAWPRIIDILALVYLLFSSARIQTLAEHRSLRLLANCGRHSLEVFSASCLLALLGRLAFRAFGTEFDMQILVNAVGLGTMLGLGTWLEHRRRTGTSVPRVASASPIQAGAAGQD